MGYLIILKQLDYF